MNLRRQHGKQVVNSLLMKTIENVSGGCQCGAIRYHVSGTLRAPELCHCRMCQKAFGNFGAVLVAAKLSELVWTRGQPSVFRSSPVVDRGFCAQCGTPLFMHEDGDDHIELALCTLDDPAVFDALDRQIGIENRLSWFAGLADLPALKTADTRPANDLAKIVNLQHPDYDTDQWPPAN